MKVACIYTGPDGKSQFGAVMLPVMGMTRGADGMTQWSNIQGARTWGIASGPHLGSDFSHWHTAQPMMSIVLQGSWEVQVGSGEQRVLELGSLTVFLDSTGQGHCSRTTSPEGSTVIGIQIDDTTLADFNAQLGIG